MDESSDCVNEARSLFLFDHKSGAKNTLTFLQLSHQCLFFHFRLIGDFTEIRMNIFSYLNYGSDTSTPTIML